MSAHVGFVGLLLLFVFAGVAYTALRAKPLMFCPLCGNVKFHDPKCPLSR